MVNDPLRYSIQADLSWACFSGKQASLSISSTLCTYFVHAACCSPAQSVFFAITITWWKILFALKRSVYGDTVACKEWGNSYPFEGTGACCLRVFQG